MSLLLLATIVAAPPQVGVSGGWVTVDGRPTVLIGDSVTQGWAELGPDFDQLAYLDDLAAHHLTAVMLWSYIGIVDPVHDERIGYVAPALFPWSRDGARFDLSRFDDDFFTRLRAFITAAGERGLVAILTIHDGWTKTRFAGHPFNAALGGPLTDRRQYVPLAEPEHELGETFDPAWDRRHRQQFYVERFTARLIEATGDLPNLIFELFNEGEWYDPDELAAFQRHAARFIRARCGRPIMVNADHCRVPLAEVADIVSLHQPNWTRDTTARQAFDHFVSARGGPERPLVFSEPVPEYRGDAADHDALMRLMWGTVLSGSSFMLQDDVSFGFAARSPMAGRRALAEEMLGRMGVAAGLVDAVDGVDRVDAAPEGRLASSRVCLAGPGWMVVYAPGDEAVRVDLSGMAGEVEVTFLDPRSGVSSAGPTLAGGAWVDLPLPGQRDWVVVLRG